MFMQTWQHCKELDIDVMMDIVDFETPRKQDREIMKMFLQSGVAGQDLICMNRCCMYLQAIFLSDICNGTGTAIDPRIWDGWVQCKSMYQWPKTQTYGSKMTSVELNSNTSTILRLQWPISSTTWQMGTSNKTGGWVFP